MTDLDPPKGCTPLPKLPAAEPSANPQPLKFELSETARQACFACVLGHVCVQMNDSVVHECVHDRICVWCWKSTVLERFALYDYT